MLPDISTYLSYAEVAMFTDASYNSFLQFTKGGMPVPRYVRLLYIVYSSVKYKFTKSPTDTSLFDTAEYMYALSGGRNITPQTPSTPFIIVTQPQSQSVDEGLNVSFFVAVTGGVPAYTYQWYFNDAVITGATSNTYSIVGLVTGDAGNYKCIIMDSAGHSLTSNDAVLTVVPQVANGSYYYGHNDYFAALSAGTDAISYQGTFAITHNQPLVIAYPPAAGNNMFLVIRVPIGESVKTNWVNVAGINYGTIIPTDFIFRVPLTPAGLPLYRYYLTQVEASFDFNNPNVLTLS